jgi:hypothetical protein
MQCRERLFLACGSKEYRFIVADFSPPANIAHDK